MAIKFDPQGIAEQWEIIGLATPGKWTESDYGDVRDITDCCVCNVNGDENRAFIVMASEAYPAALEALEASMQREAEMDAEKKRADAVTEINLRPLQPGYMGVCTTDDEDGIQIRKVSHKHPQGRGYLDDDEDVQDVVVIRFADTAQVLAVVDRLLVLADAMAEKTRQCADNTDAPTGAENS